MSKTEVIWHVETCIVILVGAFGFCFVLGFVSHALVILLLFWWWFCAILFIENLAFPSLPQYREDLIAGISVEVLLIYPAINHYCQALNFP